MYTTSGVWYLHKYTLRGMLYSSYINIFKLIIYTSNPINKIKSQIHSSPVVQIGERDAVLRADRLADDDLVDVVELIPILITDTAGQLVI
jgi:hypothetical protein